MNLSAQDARSGALSSLPAPGDAPLKTRLIRLAVALALFWLIVFVLAPLPLKYFAPMRKYADVVERTGILPGALFYNDVPQTLDAETNNRDAIRFFSGKKPPER